MIEDINELLVDLHKNELSKVGKCNLELEIRNLLAQLQSYKDKEDKLRECPNCHIDFEIAYQRVNTNDGNTYFKVSIEYCSKCMYINDCDADL